MTVKSFTEPGPESKCSNSQFSALISYGMHTKMKMKLISGIQTQEELQEMMQNEERTRKNNTYNYNNVMNSHTKRQMKPD